jgi:hypothetical protein
VDWFWAFLRAGMARMAKATVQEAMDAVRDPALAAPGIEAAHGCPVCETRAGSALADFGVVWAQVIDERREVRIRFSFLLWRGADDEDTAAYHSDAVLRSCAVRHTPPVRLIHRIASYLLFPYYVCVGMPPCFPRSSLLTPHPPSLPPYSPEPLSMQTHITSHHFASHRVAYPLLYSTIFSSSYSGAQPTATLSPKPPQSDVF